MPFLRCPGAKRAREQMRCSKPLVERFERVTRYRIARKAAPPKLGIPKPTQLIVHGSGCPRVGVRFSIHTAIHFAADFSQPRENSFRTCSKLPGRQAVPELPWCYPGARA